MDQGKQSTQAGLEAAKQNLARDADAAKGGAVDAAKREVDRACVH